MRHTYLIFLAPILGMVGILGSVTYLSDVTIGGLIFLFSFLLLVMGVATSMHEGLVAINLPKEMRWKTPGVLAKEYSAQLLHESSALSGIDSLAEDRLRNAVTINLLNEEFHTLKEKDAERQLQEAEKLLKEYDRG